MLLSIIIPIYNKAATLRRVVMSTLRQGLNDDEYEVILIDDGSTDPSYSICTQLAEEYPDTIRAITKKNEGVGPTRNLGISLAKGDYVCFVDADDYLRDGGFRDFIDHFFDSRFDVLSYYSTTVAEGNESAVASKDIHGEIRNETTGHQLLGKGFCPTFVWNSWYRKSFLVEHGLRFDSLAYGEDLLFNINLLYTNPTMRQTSSFIYVYLTYEGDNQLSKIRDKEKTTTNVLNFVKIFERMGEISQAMLQANKPCDMGTIYESTLSTFASRLLSSNLSVSQLSKIRRRIDASRITYHPLKSKTAKASNMIIHSSFFFPILKYAYCHLFVPYILPKIDRETGTISF